MNWPAYLSSGTALIVAIVSLIDRRRKIVKVHDDEACNRAKRNYEQAYDGKITINRDGLIVEANRQARFITAYNSDLKGKNFRILIPKRFQERHEEHLRRYFDNPHPRAMGAAGMELWMVDKLGNEKRVKQSLTPIEDDYGGIEVTVGIEVVQE